MALIQIYAICPLVKLALDSTGKKSYAHNKGSPNVNKSVAHETTDRCVDYSYNTIKPNLSNLFFKESLLSIRWLTALAEVQEYNESTPSRPLYFCWHSCVKGVKRHNLYLM